MEKLNKNDLADVFVLAALLSLVLWYFFNAYTASSQVINMILILPITGLIFILCAVEFINQLFFRKREIKEHEPVSAIVPVVSLFVIYVVTLPWLGFDAGTFLFIALFLWCHGERRWQWVLGYALCFASFIALFFSNMLPYPMPMLFLSTDY